MYVAVTLLSSYSRACTVIYLSRRSSNSFGELPNVSVKLHHSSSVLMGCLPLTVGLYPVIDTDDIYSWLASQYQQLTPAVKNGNKRAIKLSQLFVSSGAAGHNLFRFSSIIAAVCRGRIEVNLMQNMRISCAKLNTLRN